MSSSKIKYLKIESATDRYDGTLNSFSVDLSSASSIQNCMGAQLVGAGFTSLHPNVSSNENTVMVQTKDRVFTVPSLPDMRLDIEESGYVTQLVIPSPPAGDYTPDEWAVQAAASINTGISAQYVPYFHVQIAVVAYEPNVIFEWSLANSPRDEIVTVYASDQTAPYLGIVSDRYTIYGDVTQQYNGFPLITYPMRSFKTFAYSTFALTVPAGNYSAVELMTALNNVPSPSPTLLDLNWSLDANNLVQCHTNLGYPRIRIVSVVENRFSTLAPALGYHYGSQDFFYITHSADTLPGLMGLTNAYLHMKSISTAQTVTISTTDQQSLDVSSWAPIPVNKPYGNWIWHDFANSGETYMLDFGSDRDLTRLQVRLRDHQGNLISVGNPGVSFLIKLFLR
jgi:hypothetical protein